MPALKAVVDGSTSSEAEAAYHGVLSAVGNDHGGTMYPATLGVAPEVIRLATVENPWARWTALQIMIDWVTSFDAEPGFEMVQLPDGASVELQPTVRSLVAAAAPALRSQLQTERAAPVRVALRELLDAVG